MLRDNLGENHNFKAIFCPLNIAMPESFIENNQIYDGEECNFLKAAN